MDEDLRRATIVFYIDSLEDMILDFLHYKFPSSKILKPSIQGGDSNMRLEFEKDGEREQVFCERFKKLVIDPKWLACMY